MHKSHCHRYTFIYRTFNQDKLMKLQYLMTDRHFSNRYVELLEKKEEQPHQQQNASGLLPILTGGQVLRPYFNSVRVGPV